MSRELNNMINALNVQLAEARNNAIVQQRQAAAREAAYQQQTAAIQAQYATIAQQNQEAAEEAQARFEEQLSQSREASAATIAGLENLLIDQQNAAKAQAAQLAEQAAAAEQRYTSQLTRQARLDTAYVPENQPVASAPLVGDQRKPKTGTRTNTLSQLSIVSNPGGASGFRNQGNTQLSGLQIA